MLSACRLPLVIQSMLPSHTNSSLFAILLTAVPFLCTAVAQFFTSAHSQRTNERRFHLTTFWAIGVVCLALLPIAQMHNSPAGSFVLLTLGVIGVFGVEGISVSYYLALMGGEKGLGIAVINGLGALGGFVGPYVIGALTQTTGQYYAAMWMLAGCVMVAAINAALVSEEWAAKFSLKPGETPAMRRASSTRTHSQLPSMFGDATMAAAMVAYMEQSESSTGDADVGGHDIEQGKDKDTRTEPGCK
eukprot:GHUV01051437.1.p1 GENE.GHUV01051437.1~~GHUV01051437.1.p1  ORF type:complete len:246 (+),score=31.01 GHUV01051437.1:98-835(+)